MADRPVRNYDGEYITCYPGSNQHDDGKLNLEFNMARLVTRVTSKNFCIVKPSFELTLVRDNKGFPQIQVGTGQCSINGRDIIINQTITIDAPEKAGDFYLALHLARDPHGNVFGDQIYGVTTTFMGIYLTYFDEKPDPVTDPDILYLGKLTYDGKNITALEEDEDKYGRIWAEDILAKMKDWKHPDTTRMILQDLIYKIPDWYVSKEGDVIFGALEFLPGRDPNILGTPDIHEDLGTGKYGIRAEAILNADGTKSAKIDIKAPNIDTTDPDKTIKILVDNTGFETRLGQSVLKSNSTNNYALALTTPRDILVNSQGKVSIVGQDELVIGTGTNGQQPKLGFKGNTATFVDSTTPDLKDEIVFNRTTLQHIIGKSIFQYNNSNLSLLETNTNYFNIAPNTDFAKNIRVKDYIYLGNSATYGSEPNYLTSNKLKFVSGSNSTEIGVGSAILINPTNNAGLLTVKKNTTAYSTLYNTGKLELYNSDTNNTPKILFKNGSSGYDNSIEHLVGTNASGTTVGILSLNSKLVKATGDLTVTGDIRARKVYNAVYNGFGEIFKKDKNEIIEYGDIVCVRDDGLVHKVSNTKDLDTIIGICSDTIGVEMGGANIDKNEQVEVEMVGQIWVKTNNLDLKPGQMVEALPDGTVNETYSRYNKFGITISYVVDGKVQIVYNG